MTTHQGREGWERGGEMLVLSVPCPPHPTSLRRWIKERMWWGDGGVFCFVLFFVFLFFWCRFVAVRSLYVCLLLILFCVHIAPHFLLTGTSLQQRLMRGMFWNANDINFSLMLFPRTSLNSKLVSVHYRGYGCGLFLLLGGKLNETLK